MKILSFFLLAFLALTSTSAPGNAASIDVRLQNEMEMSGESEMIKFLIYLEDQAEVQPLAGQPTAILRSLRETADASQGELTRHLDSRISSGQVERYRRFWVVNLVSATATKRVIEEVARLPGIETLYLNDVIPPPVLPPAIEAPPPARQGITWGLETIRADQVWNQFGYTGDGVVVGSIDTGVDVNHTTIAGKMATTGDMTPGRFDANAGSLVPIDTHGHGTHTIGTMVGDDQNSDELAIGVAPGAQYYACRIFGPNPTTLEMTLEAGQWMMDPDNEPATDDFPRVVNNSWGVAESTDEWFRDMVINWGSLGIVPIFSIGNNGSASSTTGAPGNYPESFGVGATNSDEGVAGFSSRGPVTYDDVEHIKPDAGAPGVYVISARALGTDMYGDGNHFVGDANDLYWANGTSMAAPHVAGIVALMLENAPYLSVPDVEDKLAAACIDIGGPGKDNAYGWGRIDAVDAVRKPYVYSTDESGDPMSPFLPLPGEDLYCRGVEFTGGDDVEIYVVDHRDDWATNDPIGPDRSGGTETVTTDGIGDFDNHLIWPGPTVPGEYDIIVDADEDGLVDPGDAIDNWSIVGVRVYEEILLGTYHYPESPNISHFVTVTPQVVMRLYSPSDESCKNLKIYEDGAWKETHYFWTGNLYYYPEGDEVELQSAGATAPFDLEVYQTILTEVDFTPGFDSGRSTSGVELYYTTGDGQVQIQNAGGPPPEVPYPRGGQWNLEYGGEMVAATTYFPIPEETNDPEKLRLWREDPGTGIWYIEGHVPAVTETSGNGALEFLENPSDRSSRADCAVFHTNALGNFQLGEEPQVAATRASGEESDYFRMQEQVFAAGTGFPLTTPVNLYVTLAQDIWTPGDTLMDETNTVEMVFTDGGGNLSQTPVWASSTPGEFDLIVDVNQNGRYGAEDALDHIILRGFRVSGDYWVEAVDTVGIQLDEFTNDEPIYLVGSGFTAYRNSKLPLHFVLGIEDVPNDGSVIGPRALLSETEVGIDDLGNIVDPSGNLQNKAPVCLYSRWSSPHGIIIDVDRDGTFDSAIDCLDLLWVGDPSAAPDGKGGDLPNVFSISPNFPDPFHQMTTIRYALPKPAPVKLGIYDITGRSVRVLKRGELEAAGYHKVIWDGRDARGRSLPSGIYFYRLRADGDSRSHRMLFLR